MSFSLGGLASGLDTADMISKLMQLERQPYKRMEVKKGYLQSEQSVFRAINTKLKALEDSITDLKLSSTFNLASAKSSDESAVKVTSQDGASAGSFNVQVTQTAKSHSIVTKSFKNDNSELSDQQFIVRRTGKEDITINTNGMNNAEALEHIKNQLNNSDSGISASVMTVDDAGNQVLMLSSKETGLASNFIAVGDPPTPPPDPNPGIDIGKSIGLAGDGFNLLGFGTTADIDSTDRTTQEALDAMLSVNGVSITQSSNKIENVISGVTLELFKDNSTVRIDIAQDTDKIAEKIEKFVNDYNDAISTVRDNMKKPADESKMNPLQGDSVLKDINNSLHSLFTGVAGDSYFKMMSAIGLEIDKGITTGSLMTGKISFDKELFNNKLTEDSNAVIKLFGDANSGIITQIDKQLGSWTSSVDGLLASKIKGYDSEIKNVDDRLVAMEERLVMKENQLNRQFTAMEVAMSRLNNEKQWLASQFAALTPSKAK